MYCAQAFLCFITINTFNIQKKSHEVGIIFTLQMNGEAETLSNLPKVTQPICDRGQTKPRQLSAFRVHVLHHHHCCHHKLIADTVYPRNQKTKIITYKDCTEVVIKSITNKS